MELIYRGIKYKSEQAKFSGLARNKKLPITYCRKLVKTATNNKFPLLKYCKQLFSYQVPPVCDPAEFFHQHQSQLLENCWQLNVIKQLNLCWETTLKIELEKNLPSNPPVQLKYRGVTYYR